MRRAVLATLALAGLLGGCQSSPTTAPTPARSPAPRDTVAPSFGSFPAAAPSPVVLPNPGGTCTAGQFVTRSATLVGLPASLGTAHVLVTQPVENAGADCVLAVPEIIGLASGSEPLTAIEVRNLGVSICTNGSCHHEYPASVGIASGQRFEILVSAWWWLPTSDAVSHPPCDRLIADVSSAAFPMHEGTLAIAWATGILREACSSPPSISVGVDTA